MEMNEFNFIRKLCKEGKLHVEDYKGEVMKITDIDPSVDNENNIKYNLIPDWNTRKCNLEHEIKVLEGELERKKEELTYLGNENEN